jgi:urease accessory protein
VGFFEGYTHQATIAYFLDEMDRAPVVEKLYEILQSFNNVEAGITTTYKYGIVIRLLSNGSDYLEGIVKKLRKEIYNCSFGV